MNKKQYASYEKRVAEFFEREGIANLSEVCSDREPSFSHRPCDCCNRPESGNRYDCAGYNPTTKEIQDEYSICEDCRWYAEYGCLDDDTMYEIENS